ncbi:hypothetical protein V6N13_013129 [Hibiscus sabdariffa]
MHDKIVSRQRSDEVESDNWQKVKTTEGNELSRDLEENGVKDKEDSNKLYGVKKGDWSAEEDQKLTSYLQSYGKSCRLRWINYLRPGIDKGEFTSEEDQTLYKLHVELGSSSRIGFGDISLDNIKEANKSILQEEYIRKAVVCSGMDHEDLLALSAGNSLVAKLAKEGVNHADLFKAWWL